jgi:hypothetical protein
MSLKIFHEMNQLEKKLTACLSLECCLREYCQHGMIIRSLLH